MQPVQLERRGPSSMRPPHVRSSVVPSVVQPLSLVLLALLELASHTRCTRLAPPIGRSLDAPSLQASMDIAVGRAQQPSC